MTVLPDLVQTFRFSVKLTVPKHRAAGRLAVVAGHGWVQRVQRADPGSRREGDPRGWTLTSASCADGRVKLEPLVLKRGMFLKNEAGHR